MDCVYREPGIKLTTGEKLIMEDLDKVKAFLQATLGGDRRGGKVNIDSPRTSAIMLESRENTMARNTGGIEGELSAPQIAEQGQMPISNSTFFAPQKLLITPALDLLRWPKIETLVIRPRDPQSLLQVELTREPLHIDPPLSLDLEETSMLVRAFFERVNIWYACVNPLEWTAYYQKAEGVLFREGPESCVVLLVLALGSASLEISVSQLPKSSDRAGILYFSAAWSLLPTLILSNTIIALQCSILAAAYLSYLVRPLEAWTLVSSSSMRLQSLLRVPGTIPEQSIQLSERLYWNMFLMESDLLNELDLPSTGILQTEEHISLPTFFQDFQDSPGRDEIWYLRAAVDLRRVRTRISHEISSRESSSPDDLHAISQDLDVQLYEWYESLPVDFRFSLTPGLLHHPAQTILRLRYCATRTLIFRPYVLAVLDDENASRIPFVREHCRTCLVSSIRLLEDISVDRSGHVPYLWHNALLFVSHALLVMGATMSPSLLQFLPPKEQLDGTLMDVVEEIERYADLAPSLRVCAELMREAEERRRTLLQRSLGMGY